MADFNSDLEKITEVLDDRISKLRDHLENARTMTTDKFFNDLNTNDYYRNKKRIQDTKSKVISYNYNSNKSGNSFKSRISSQFMGNKDSNGNKNCSFRSNIS